MTLANTDLHPSHTWEEGEIEDSRTYFCSACLACSCCVGSGATGNCIGEDGLYKEVMHD